MRKWLNFFAMLGDVRSGSRSGRLRCTDEASDTTMAVVARIDKFTSQHRDEPVTPKLFPVPAAELTLDCSSVVTQFFLSVPLWELVFTFPTVVDDGK